MQPVGLLQYLLQYTKERLHDWPHTSASRRGAEAPDVQSWGAEYHIGFLGFRYYGSFYAFVTKSPTWRVLRFLVLRVFSSLIYTSFCLLSTAKIDQYSQICRFRYFINLVMIKHFLNNGTKTKIGSDLDWFFWVDRQDRRTDEQTDHAMHAWHVAIPSISDTFSRSWALSQPIR